MTWFPGSTLHRASKSHNPNRGRWRLAHSRTDAGCDRQRTLDCRRISNSPEAEREDGERRDRASEITWRSGYIELEKCRRIPQDNRGHSEMDFGSGLVCGVIHPTFHASLSALDKKRKTGDCVRTHDLRERRPARRGPSSTIVEDLP